MRGRLLLAALVLFSLGVTLPWLDRFPLLEAAQCGIAAPAWKLATTGVYGNDLYAGFHRTEELNYEYLPLFPLAVAGSFRLFGLGVLPARAVPVAAGIAVLVLTARLGRRIAGEGAGLGAAAALAFVSLGLFDETTGIPLLDLARVLRYDIFVPVFVVAGCLALLTALETGSLAWFAVAGGLTGLATLSHVIGAFALPLLALVVLSAGAACGRRLGAMTAGFGAALFPWLLYVARDVDAFRGQMTRHDERFDLLNPAFYLENVLRERLRFHQWLHDDAGRLVLFPRPGLWLVVSAVGLGTIWLVRRRAERSVGETLLLLSLPVLSLQMALLLSYKRYPYVLLLLPFLALHVGVLAARVGRRPAVALLLVAVLVEGLLGARRGLAAARRASPYVAVCARIEKLVPPGGTILGMHEFWLGLAGHRYRALDLAFKLSDPHARVEPLLTFDEAVARIAPDAIVIEEEILLKATSPEGRRERPAAARYYDLLSAYLASGKVRLAGTVVDPSYGTIRVYHVGAH